MPDKPVDEGLDKPLDKSLEQLKETSKLLKEKIEHERQAQDMPIDSELGDPNWEAKAADGRFDLPDEDDE